MINERRQAQRRAGDRRRKAIWTDPQAGRDRRNRRQQDRREAIKITRHRRKGDL